MVCYYFFNDKQTAIDIHIACFTEKSKEKIREE